MSKLEEMMKAGGWTLGYDENWSVKYWSFRKDGFEIQLNDIDLIDPIEHSGKHFKKWRKENE